MNNDGTSRVTWHVVRLWADNEVAAGTVMGLNSPGWALFPLLLVFNFVVVIVVVVRATAGRAARTSGRARTSRGSKGLVYYEIIDYIINAPSRGSKEERMGIPCW